MELLGIYFIKANSFVEKYIALSDLYEISVEKSGSEIEITTNKKSNTRKPKFYHDLNKNLEIRLLHGINGTGKTTILRALNFDLALEYLIFYEKGNGIYIEGNSFIEYSYTINKYKSENTNTQTKSYFSLYYEEGIIEFYDWNEKKETIVFSNMGYKTQLQEVKKLVLKVGLIILPELI